MRRLARYTATALAFTLAVASGAALRADPFYWQDQLAEIRRHIQHIDTAELRRWVEGDEDFLLIDVRMPDEIAADGHIDAPQYVNIPRGWLEVRISEHALDGESTIVLHCGAALRSAYATDTLWRMGYVNVFNYRDGLNGWRDAGLPVVE